MTDGVEQQPAVSRAAGIRVREADLGARSMIGSGSATEVFRLDAFTVPGHHGGLAFVSARDRQAEHWDSAVLSRLVALRWALPARERAMLDAVAAWPLAVVEGEDHTVVGCLVPLAAHPFYYLPAEEPATGSDPDVVARAAKVAQNARWLVAAPKRARKAGAASVGERDLIARATVLARVSLLLEVLHRHGVVFGDLSERSVLFGVGEVAEAFVVGCEGAALVGEGTLQRNSAGWAAPESFAGVGADGVGADGVGADGDGGDATDGEGADGADATDGAAHDSLSTAPTAQTLETDRYKLGLLILRVLAPAGDGLDRSRDAGRIARVLDDDGRRMLDAALGDDPAARPSVADWYAYLRGVIVSQLEPPVIRRVSVSPALVAEGDEVRLEVEVTGAKQLTIEMPGRADITREVGRRIVTERFTARQTGRIGVRAVNGHGEAAALSDPVRVLPVPAPAQIAVAAPRLPEGLGVLPDLASLEAALGISIPPSWGGDSAGAADGSSDPSSIDRVVELREQLEADALPLRDVMRIGLEAERVSREQLFPAFEEFFGDITSSRRRPDRGSGSAPD